MSEVMSIAHSVSISRGSFSPLPGEEEEHNQGITTRQKPKRLESHGRKQRRRKKSPVPRQKP